MNTKLLKEKLDKLKHIEDLNRGGCLYAAYGVYLSLKQDGVDVSNLSIIQLSAWNNSEIEANKSFLKGDTQNAVSSSHFGLSINNGDEVLDSNGIVDKCDYEYHLTIPSNQIEPFSKSALKNGSWNFMFDKETGIEEINKALNIQLKDFKK